MTRTGSSLRRQAMVGLALLSLALLTGCGGGGRTTINFTSGGESFGHGVCEGNHCDLVFGAPQLRARRSYTPEGEVIVLEPGEGARLHASQSPRQLVVDEQRVRGVLALPVGTLMQDGAQVGCIDPAGRVRLGPGAFSPFAGLFAT